MTTEQLRSAINARPFQPFTIHLADGRHLDVRHPEWVAYAGGRIATVFTNPNAAEFVDLLLVTSLEVKTAPPRRPRKK